MTWRLFLAAISLSVSAPALAGGAVYTMSDDAAANAVLAFARSGDGALRPLGAFPTGGQGSGGGEGVLGSQGAIALTGDGRFLLAVNAGSDEVSAFRVLAGRLFLTGRAPSGGALPVSVAEHDGLVYVLNAGGAGNISGLRLGEHGELRPLAESSQPLTGSGVGPAQIAFDDSGEILAVTEKGAQAIAVYRIDRRGLPSPPRAFPSAGVTPFGFAFTRRDVLVVSEAAGGAPGASTASSYDLDDGELDAVSPAIPTGQTAACWLVTTRRGRDAFVANTASGSISHLRIERRGGLTLVDGAAGAIPGGQPLDIALSRGDRFLYVLDPGHGAIHGFAVAHDGGLTDLGPLATGLPPSAVGLAAR
jgi:6-phosphogluconolactonase